MTMADDMLAGWVPTDLVAARSRLATPPSDREPVGTYVQACGWLWRFSDTAEWLFDETQPLPIEARFLCDVFWVDEQTLRRDLKRQWKEVGG